MNVSSKTMSRGKIKTNALVKVSPAGSYFLPFDLYQDAFTLFS